MNNMDTPQDIAAKQAALRLVAGCLKNARCSLWLADYEKDILTILGEWIGKYPIPGNELQLVQEAYERHLKDENDMKAEAARQRRCQEESGKKKLNPND